MRINMETKNRIMFGVLNYRDDVSSSLEIIQGLRTLTYDTDIILATKNNLRRFWKSDDIKETIIPEDQIINIENTSIAKAKNELLKKARELGADYFFIIEDDVKIKDLSVFYEYTKLMETFGLGFCCHGYGEHINTIFQKPNPALSVYDDATKQDIYVWNRYPFNVVTVYDLRINKELYDETLEFLELKEYVIRCKEKGLIPFLGFFMDVPYSWKKIGRQTEVLKCRKLDPKKIHAEKELVDKRWTQENDPVKVLNHIKEILYVPKVVTI